MTTRTALNSLIRLFASIFTPATTINPNADKLALYQGGTVKKVSIALVTGRVPGPDPAPTSGGGTLDLSGLAGTAITVTGTDDVTDIVLEEGRRVQLEFEDQTKFVYDDAAIVIPGRANLGVLPGDKITLVGLAGGIVEIETLPPAPPINVYLDAPLAVSDDNWLTFAEFNVRAGTVYKFDAVWINTGTAPDRWNFTSSLTGSLLVEVSDGGNFVFSTSDLGSLGNLDDGHTLRLSGILKAPATETVTFQFKNDAAGSAELETGTNLTLIPVGTYVP